MSSLDPTGLLAALAASATAVVVVMVAARATATRAGKHSVVDVAWGLGFALVAVMSYLVTLGVGDPARRLLVLLLPVAWGARLALHLARRNAGKLEDPRYQELLTGQPGGPPRSPARTIYLPQGLAMLAVSLPLPVAAATDPPLQWWAWAGVLVWGVGMFFETIGDRQLARFKADPANAGQVMDRGLWRYTRHPNYFGDACVWWGIWLVAAASWPGLALVVCPILMTYFLAVKTGKGPLERSLSSTKPGYADYVARTSGFVPRAPRHSRWAPRHRR